MDLHTSTIIVDVFYFDLGRVRALKCRRERGVGALFGTFGLLAVMSTDGEVVTVGHRIRRFRHDSAQNFEVGEGGIENVPKTIYR